MFRACARRYNSTCGGRHLSKVTPATACGCRGIHGIRRIRAICGRCGIRTGFVEFIGFAGFVKSASSSERLFSATSGRATFLKTSLRRRHVRVRLLAPLPKPVTVERWDLANVAGVCGISTWLRAATPDAFPVDVLVQTGCPCDS